MAKKQRSVNAIDSEDLAQHLALAAARAGLQGASLEASLQNALVDYLRMSRRDRRRAAKTRSLDDLLEEPAVPSFLDQLIAIDAADAALARLDPVARAAVIQRHLRNETRADIAKSLGLSNRAVRKLLQQAMAAMRTP